MAARELTAVRDLEFVCVCRGRVCTCVHMSLGTCVGARQRAHTVLPVPGTRAGALCAVLCVVGTAVSPQGSRAFSGGCSVQQGHVQQAVLSPSPGPDWPGLGAPDRQASRRSGASGALGRGLGAPVGVCAHSCRSLGAGLRRWAGLPRCSVLLPVLPGPGQDLLCQLGPREAPGSGSQRNWAGSPRPSVCPSVLPAAGSLLAFPGGSAVCLWCRGGRVLRLVVAAQAKEEASLPRPRPGLPWAAWTSPRALGAHLALCLLLWTGFIGTAWSCGRGCAAATGCPRAAPISAVRRAWSRAPASSGASTFTLSPFLVCGQGQGVAVLSPLCLPALSSRGRPLGPR